MVPAVMVRLPIKVLNSLYAEGRPISTIVLYQGSSTDGVRGQPLHGATLSSRDRVTHLSHNLQVLLHSSLLEIGPRPLANHLKNTASRVYPHLILATGRPYKISLGRDCGTMEVRVLGRWF